MKLGHGLAALLVVSPVVGGTTNAVESPLVFCCEVQNDLFKTVKRAVPTVTRTDTPAEAVDAAPEGAGVLILADGYPKRRTPLSTSVLRKANAKKLRLYIEFPESLPGLTVGSVRHDHRERVIVMSDMFKKRGLEPMRLMQVNGMHYVTVQSEKAHLVAGRVAGFDRAVYGLPKATFPILSSLDEMVLVGTTGLSHFIRARFAPRDAVGAIWQTIIEWLAGGRLPSLPWEPVVAASYARHGRLPADVQRQAVLRGARWYDRSKMITGPEGNPDGSAGIREAVLSRFNPDGTQVLGEAIRGDCTAESAMALAFASAVGGEQRYADIAARALDFYLFESDARKKERGDPKNGNYGLTAWGVSSPAWYKANYGDDNARLMLATLAAGALLETDRWDEAMMKCLLANLRTTGRKGFRTGRIDVGPLTANGWEHYFRSSPVNPHPHFEAYLWACYLWAYNQTGDGLFLRRAKSALTITMEHFPDRMRWTNGLAQEKARIVLPLAWLVRVEDTAANRAMLKRATDALIALQAPCGTITEEIGDLRLGQYPPPRSNEAYGSNEASLIAENGDPVADLLYTVNFAFLALHEAAAATGDADIIAAEDGLAEFLCRIQVASPGLPQVDGGWFRAFDFERWEPWASNADHGWGAWAIESGWTQGWIMSVLAMREMKTSLWDLTKDSEVEKHHKCLREQMLPANVLEALEPRPIKHAAVGRKVSYSVEPSPSYPDPGDDLVSGSVSGADYLDSDWVGWQGQDVVIAVDLGSQTRITQLDLHGLKSTRVGIHLPKSVTYSVSQDGKRFTAAGSVERPKKAAAPGDAVQRYPLTGLRLHGRYVRVEPAGEITIPPGHTAAGRKAWLFLGEVIVNPAE